jgi:hypothetical protein
MSIWTGFQKREAASLNRRAPTGYRRYFPFPKGGYSGRPAKKAVPP